MLGSCENKLRKNIWIDQANMTPCGVLESTKELRAQRHRPRNKPGGITDERGHVRRAGSSLAVALGVRCLDVYARPW